MSHPPKDAGINLDQKHGSVLSYAVGFVLSLVFTLLPYYLVVNKAATGTVLLLAIFGFALAQLIVQIVFFLHLGRGPKPNWNLYFFISTAAIIMVVVGGSIFIINNLNYNMLPSQQAKRLIEGEGIAQIEGKETGACKGQHEKHKVTIRDGEASPLYTYAKKCDVLILISEDKENIEIAFGNHPERQVYAGRNILHVMKSRSQSLVLSELGEYQFYDLDNPDTTGYFIVKAE